MGTERIPEPSEQATPTPTTLIWNDHETEVVKGRQHRSSVWLYGPAMLELMSIAFRRLLKVAAETQTDLAGNPLDLAGNQLTKVRAARPKGKKTIYIVPTSDTDPEGIPVHKDRSSTFVNLITLLGPAKLTVTTGYRERYEAEFADPEKDPIFPALKISLINPLERRKIRRDKTETK